MSAIYPELSDNMFELAHEFVGEDGLAWSRRLNRIHAGLQRDGGFPERVAQYLAKKYGYSVESGETSGQRVIGLLERLTSRLKAQRQAGSPYYFGDAVTAADVYSATCIALFAPLPSEQCDMNPRSREVFSTLDQATQDALDPVLVNHRDMMYEKYLQLPLSL